MRNGFEENVANGSSNGIKNLRVVHRVIQGDFKIVVVFFDCKFQGIDSFLI